MESDTRICGSLRRPLKIITIDCIGHDARHMIAISKLDTHFIAFAMLPLKCTSLAVCMSQSVCFDVNSISIYLFESFTPTFVLDVHQKWQKIAKFKWAGRT